jgi:sugar fermentation stimulation protein A
LRQRKAIRVGKLGAIVFPQGTYLYAGSARNGLKARLAHHLKRPKKRKHWHIDYLLDCPQAKISKIFFRFASPLRECDLVKRLKKIPTAQIVVRRFGDSDCVMGCGSHLIHFAREPMSVGLGKGISLPAVKKLVFPGKRRSIG